MISGARRVTDDMFLAASRALAGQVTDADLVHGRVFPAPGRMRDVAVAVATAVASVAYEQGLAAVPVPRDIAAEAERQMWVPSYA
jgi:malate dehydrogenase (oxaloacetate-decarboxylating)(NADP+)